MVRIQGIYVNFNSVKNWPMHTHLESNPFSTLMDLKMISVVHFLTVNDSGNTRSHMSMQKNNTKKTTL